MLLLNLNDAGDSRSRCFFCKRTDAERRRDDDVEVDEEEKTLHLEEADEGEKDVGACFAAALADARVTALMLVLVRARCQSVVIQARGRKRDNECSHFALGCVATSVTCGVLI